MKWNRDFAELIAPYFERLIGIVENGPDEKNPKEVEFYNAVTNGATPERPLQAAWLTFHELPEKTRADLRSGFAAGDREEKIRLSKAAAERLESQGWEPKVDFYQEMLDQGISAPNGKIVEPLGSREVHLRERANNKYNGR